MEKKKEQSNKLISQLVNKLVLEENCYDESLTQFQFKNELLQ